MTTNIAIPDHTYFSVELLHSSISIDLITTPNHVKHILGGVTLFYVDICKEGGGTFTFDETITLVAKYSAEAISLCNDGSNIGNISVLVHSDGSADLIV